MYLRSGSVSLYSLTGAAKSKFNRTKKIIEDLAFHQVVMIAPQPIYYITCEFMKICGNYSTVYYPQPGAIVGWIILIIVMWAP